jgi:hypothetical protein
VGTLRFAPPYSPLNGFVYYDSNGSGAGHEVHFATLAHNLALSQVDFLA